jgi:hypothetical protein
VLGHPLIRTGQNLAGAAANPAAGFLDTVTGGLLNTVTGAVKNAATQIGRSAHRFIVTANSVVYTTTSEITSAVNNPQGLLTQLSNAPTHLQSQLQAYAQHQIGNFETQLSFFAVHDVNTINAASGGGVTRDYVETDTTYIADIPVYSLVSVATVPAPTPPGGIGYVAPPNQYPYDTYYESTWSTQLLFGTKVIFYIPPMQYGLTSSTFVVPWTHEGPSFPNTIWENI